MVQCATIVVLPSNEIVSGRVRWEIRNVTIVILSWFFIAATEELEPEKLCSKTFVKRFVVMSCSVCHVLETTADPNYINFVLVFY